MIKKKKRVIIQTKNKCEILLMYKYDISKHKFFFIHPEENLICFCPLFSPMASRKHLKTIEANIPHASLNMLDCARARAWMSLWTRTLYHLISCKKGPGALLTWTRANNLQRVRVASLQTKSINLKSGKSIARTGKGNRTDAQKATEKNRYFLLPKQKKYPHQIKIFPLKLNVSYKSFLKLV